MEDYSMIENWSKAKTKEELERLEPIVEKLRKHLRLMEPDEINTVTGTFTGDYISWT